MSSDGKYQYVCSSGYGVIYYSSNYGSNWTEIVNSYGYDWTRVCVSPNNYTLSSCYQVNTDTFIDIETLSIYFNGNVGINNEYPVYKLDINGNVQIKGDTGSSNYSLRTDGVIQALNFVQSSDYRIKENPIFLDNLIDNKFTIDNLKPILYRNKISNKIDLGLIAHEVEKEFPFLVCGEKDGEDYQTVNYIGLIPLLIHEIKKLKEQLKNK
jgi:hypothetical protein